MVKCMCAMMKTQIELQSKTNFICTNYNVYVDKLVFMFLEKLTSLSLLNIKIFCMTILSVLIKSLIHLKVNQSIIRCLLIMLML